MNWRKASFVILYVGLVTGLIYAAFAHWAYDDPFITYRYAENLAQGKGFVYNPGERVLSTTTPLFALLLAILSKVWADLPALSNLIGAFGIAIGAIFLWDLANTWQAKLAGWAMLAIYPTFTLLLSTLGSESPLYLALCLGAFAGYARQKYIWTAVFAALALLTRGDGLLVGVVLGIDYLARARQPVPWKAVVIYLLIALPWFGFAWAYFGSPLPATLAAKQSQGSLAISQGFAEGFISLARDHLAFWEFKIQAILAATGVIYAIARQRRWIVFFSWTMLYFLAYTALGVSRYFWYYAPLVPGFLAAVGLGIAALGKLPQKQADLSTKKRFFTASTLLPLFLLAPLAVAQIQNVSGLRGSSDRRYEVYKQAGNWLKQHTPASAVVGALEVGIIGYYAQRSMVDFAGLLQPDIAAQLTPHTTYEDAAIWAMGCYQPEYLVLHDRLFPRLEQEVVAQRCQSVQKFDGKDYGYSADMVIYTCAEYERNACPSLPE